MQVLSCVGYFLRPAVEWSAPLRAVSVFFRVEDRCICISVRFSRWVWVHLGFGISHIVFSVCSSSA